ncbi:MAG: carboxypeptidase-like regulatory domain-containing protein [Muribaculaceae bacterium]|nr:carboxypeptidase-like regulatory domain-containing protein [Muribaculaceae bacterium]
MCRQVILIIYILTLFPSVYSREAVAIVVDADDNTPLPKASVFDRYGKFAGLTSENGEMPPLDATDYPVSIRCIGYDTRTISRPASGRIRMYEKTYELPEAVVSSHRQEVLHLTGYLREFSTLTTYSDTVTLFREKAVDYMLPKAQNRKFRGWRIPRVLASKSYYRFTDINGLDSVSDRFRQHFSWSDWVGIASRTDLPMALRGAELASDTTFGKYSRSLVWHRNGSRVDLDIDLLADTCNLHWAPGIASFIRDGLDVYSFNMKYTFAGVGENEILPNNISGMTYVIETKGRALDLFRVFHHDTPYYVNTYAELYITGREYLSVKEARMSENHPPEYDGTDIAAPSCAPELEASVKALIERVNNIDRSKEQLAATPDRRLSGAKWAEKHKKNRFLQFLKSILH